MSLDAVKATDTAVDPSSGSNSHGDVWKPHDIREPEEALAALGLVDTDQLEKAHEIYFPEHTWEPPSENRNSVAGEYLTIIPETETSITIETCYEQLLQGDLDAAVFSVDQLKEMTSESTMVGAILSVDSPTPFHDVVIVATPGLPPEEKTGIVALFCDENGKIIQKFDISKTEVGTESDTSSSYAVTVSGIPGSIEDDIVASIMTGQPDYLGQSFIATDTSTDNIDIRMVSVESTSGPDDGSGSHKLKTDTRAIPWLAFTKEKIERRRTEVDGGANTGKPITLTEKVQEGLKPIYTMVRQSRSLLPDLALQTEDHLIREFLTHTKSVTNATYFEQSIVTNDGIEVLISTEPPTNSERRELKIHIGTDGSIKYQRDLFNTGTFTAVPCDDRSAEATYLRAAITGESSRVGATRADSKNENIVCLCGLGEGGDLIVDVTDVDAMKNLLPWVATVARKAQLGTCVDVPSIEYHLREEKLIAERKRLNTILTAAMEHIPPGFRVEIKDEIVTRILDHFSGQYHTTQTQTELNITGIDLFPIRSKDVKPIFLQFETTDGVYRFVLNVSGTPPGALQYKADEANSWKRVDDISSKVLLANLARYMTLPDVQQFQIARAVSENFSRCPIFMQLPNGLAVEVDIGNQIMQVNRRNDDNGGIEFLSNCAWDIAQYMHGDMQSVMTPQGWRFLSKEEIKKNKVLVTADAIDLTQQSMEQLALVMALAGDIAPLRSFNSRYDTHGVGYSSLLKAAANGILTEDTIRSNYSLTSILDFYQSRDIGDMIGILLTADLPREIVEDTKRTIIQDCAIDTQSGHISPTLRLASLTDTPAPEVIIDLSLGQITVGGIVVEIQDKNLITDRKDLEAALEARIAVSSLGHLGSKGSETSRIVTIVNDFLKEFEDDDDRADITFDEQNPPEQLFILSEFDQKGGFKRIRIADGYQLLFNSHGEWEVQENGTTRPLDVFEVGIRDAVLDTPYGILILEGITQEMQKAESQIDKTEILGALALKLLKLRQERIEAEEHTRLVEEKLDYVIDKLTTGSAQIEDKINIKMVDAAVRVLTQEISKHPHIQRLLLDTNFQAGLVISLLHDETWTRGGKLHRPQASDVIHDCLEWIKTLQESGTMDIGDISVPFSIETSERFGIPIEQEFAHRRLRTRLIGKPVGNGRFKLNWSKCTRAKIPQGADIYSDVYEPGIELLVTPDNGIQVVGGTNGSYLEAKLPEIAELIVVADKLQATALTFTLTKAEEQSKKECERVKGEGITTDEIVIERNEIEKLFEEDEDVTIEEVFELVEERIRDERIGKPNQDSPISEDEIIAEIRRLVTEAVGDYTLELHDVNTVIEIALGGIIHSSHERAVLEGKNKQAAERISRALGTSLPHEDTIVRIGSTMHDILYATLAYAA